MKYIFPDFLAKAMAKVDQRTQYESSMMSMSLMSIGLVLSAVYMCIYTELMLWFKIVIVINSFFGILFMWSYIVMTYQQYNSYMEAKAFQDEIKNNAKKSKGGNE